MMSDTALPIGEVERRPISVTESKPYRIVGIDRYRIINPHVLRGSSNVVDVSLERELRRVHADYHQSFVLIFLGPRANVGKRASPIDAGIRPEVDEDDLPGQV